MLRKLLGLVFVSCIMVPEVMLRPPSRSYSKNVEDYLTQFGYLPRSSSGSMRTHQQMENAVKNLQFYAGLNVTGVIDDATVDLMAK